MELEFRKPVRFLLPFQTQIPFTTDLTNCLFKLNKISRDKNKVQKAEKTQMKNGDIYSVSE